MQTQTVNINLPLSVRDDFSERRILQNLLDQAFAKKEYYISQQRLFEGKYKTTLTQFKRKYKKNKKEKFDWWDDLMEWEACSLASNEWNKKYKDLLHCWKSSKK